MKYIVTIFTVLCFLCGCSERSIPLNKGEWRSWDNGISNKRYNMAIWMIKTGLKAKASLI